MKYLVVAPILGIATMHVEADTEEQAIEKAFKDGSFQLDQWDAVEQVVEGNVFHGEINEAYVEEQPE